MVEISVVTPVYNEEGSILELFGRLRETLDSIDHAWEIVFVDDGSVDSSVELIRQLHAEDTRVRLIRFSRNFGHHIAITAGLDESVGKYVVIMDSDLQDRPEDIPRLLEKLKSSNCDMVVARRQNKKFGLIKRINAQLFNGLMSRLLGKEFVGGVFRVLTRRVVDEVKRCREHDRLLVGLIEWTGFQQSTLDVEHGERFAGETKYSFGKQLALAANSITAFSVAPLRLGTWLGLISALSAFCLTAYFVFRRLVWGLGVEGWTSLLVVILMMGGVQMLLLGVLGEYLARIFTATRDRPLYIVSERL